jgi:hypothetical protein
MPPSPRASTHQATTHTHLPTRILSNHPTHTHPIQFLSPSSNHPTPSISLPLSHPIHNPAPPTLARAAAAAGDLTVSRRCLRARASVVCALPPHARGHHRCSSDLLPPRNRNPPQILSRTHRSSDLHFPRSSPTAPPPVFDWRYFATVKSVRQSSHLSGCCSRWGPSTGACSRRVARRPRKLLWQPRGRSSRW